MYLEAARAGVEAHHHSGADAGPDASGGLVPNRQALAEGCEIFHQLRTNATPRQTGYDFYRIVVLSVQELDGPRNRFENSVTSIP